MPALAPSEAFALGRRVGPGAIRPSRGAKGPPRAVCEASRPGNVPCTFGPDHLRPLEQGLAEWLAVREYESVEQLKGSLCQGSVTDPAAFERANYVRTLKSWSSSFRA